MAKASGKNVVKTGEIVNAEVGFAEVNDLYLQTINSFYEMDGTKVWDSEKLAFVFDHYAPAPNINSAEIHKKMRDFASKNKLKYHFDINCGICHQVMPESGVIKPGEIIAATDSHTTTHGAFGALGTGVGATDMAIIMISGKMWMKVPEIIEIKIEGKPKDYIMPKDVILNILGKIKADGAVYKAIEFTGEYVENLNIAGRMVLCNMAVEMGAKTAYIQPNDEVLNYIKSKTNDNYEVQYTDKNYRYSDYYSFDISELEPQVAIPYEVDNVKPVTEIQGEKIYQGFIGTCTGGREEDIKIAANILKGKKIPRFTRLLIIPASSEVMIKCMEKGYIKELMDAGATISTPGCGPCLGAHEGVLAENEVCISASNRNFPGRMGSKKSKVYLSSPATVAASVLNGCISNPSLLGGEIWKL
ncbi:MAG: 3-isopropylmalate dehydratase large subunit [Bacillota bacterium]|nr:3-isopropylmalate dehydratase large subunit [Bacillota bacterium]